MRGFAGLLGWIGAWGYAIALINYFIKFIYKKYIVKLPPEKKKYANIYRMIMKYIVKYHKIIGIIASISIMAHFYLMYTSVRLSITGLLAAIIMWCIFLLGIFGAYINKNVRGKWVKVHRFLAFALIALIFIHLVFKG